MQTDALTLAKQTVETGQSERLSWGVVEFQVTDLDRAIVFWTTAFGLRVRSEDSKTAALGTKKQTLFILHAGASKPASPRCLGMYHVALGMPDQAEFSRIFARLDALNVPISPVDHLMSKAFYISDPDGLEIEIALETPERFGRFGDMSRGLVLYDVNEQPHSGREHLNSRAELAHADGADLEAPLSDGACLSHLHFKVAALEPAAAWFEGIGFSRNLMLPHFGFADLGAGAAYTHRLAINTWAGPNLSPAPSDMARLTRYTLHAHNPEVFANARGLKRSEKGLTSLDPTGTELSLQPLF